MEIVHLQHPIDKSKIEQQPTVIALGFFDGVHIGHQKVIYTAKQKAKELGVKTSVMTFHPHPSNVFMKKAMAQAYITPLDKKAEQIAKLGVDVMYVVTFDEHFARLSPQAFVDQYLIALHAIHVVTGFDFSYGHKREGKAADFPTYAHGKFTSTIVPKLTENDEKISSTKIRKHIKSGQVEHIEPLLGRKYSVEGIVVHGNKRGRTIGFPTANIQVTKDFLLPTTLGVYVVRIQVGGKWYHGMCNIGYNPTFSDVDELRIEVYILDFQETIYGQTVEVEWCAFIRDEKKFASVEEIISQLETDREITRAYFQKHEDSTCKK